MNVLITILLLAGTQLFSFVWGIGFEYLQISNMLVQMCAYAVIDLLTISLIARYPVQFLTKYLQILLCLSIIGHAIGAFWWVTYNNPALALYDEAKIVIFCLELAGFFIYGITRPGKRRRAVAFPTRISVVHSVQGRQRNTAID